MALIAGVQAPPGRVMGHAGAFVGTGEKTALDKVRALQDAGVVITNHPSKFGDGMKQLLSHQGQRTPSVSPGTAQRRNLHTLRRPLPEFKGALLHTQRRKIHIPESHSFQMLKDLGVSISEDHDPSSRDYFLTVTVDRTAYTPCIISSYLIGGESSQHHAKTYPLRLDKSINQATFSSIASDLNCGEESFESLTTILSAMFQIFFEKEASSLSVRISRNTPNQLSVARSTFSFDDAAYRSGKRHSDIQEVRDTSVEVPEEVEAEKDGIVYIK